MSVRAAAFVLAVCTVSGACRRDAPQGPVVAPPAPDAMDLDASEDGEGGGGGEGGVSAAKAQAVQGPLLDARQRFDKGICGGVLRAHATYGVGAEDATSWFVDGDDLLALVNRSPSGKLSPSYAPGDLVSITTGKAKTAAQCNAEPCLRKAAADALDELLAAMKQRGFPGAVISAYRGYAVQCATFQKWARQSSFCTATEQSALPGHSQHQLGTTVDLFTQEWAQHPHGVFRDGFGCTDGGRFLAEHAWELGWVLPYPLHPDDRSASDTCRPRRDVRVTINARTGYKYEHWHMRFLGKEAARAFHEAHEKSGPGTANELTLEQWLRERRRLPRDIDLPVCDGCLCGACATVGEPGTGPCKDHALWLDGNGQPRVDAKARPTLESAEIKKAKGAKHAELEVTVESPPFVVTQPPVIDRGDEPEREGWSMSTFVPRPSARPRRVPRLAGTTMLSVRLDGGDAKHPTEWLVALTSAHGKEFNLASTLLPVRVGKSTLRVPLPDDVTRVEVALDRDGAREGARTVLREGGAAPPK